MLVGGGGVQQHRSAELCVVRNRRPVSPSSGVLANRTAGSSGDLLATHRSGSRGPRSPASPGVRQPARGFRARCLRLRECVPGRHLGVRREAAGHEVLVGRLPHRAGRLLLTPPGRARGAVAPVVRLVGGEHRPPTLGQPGEFGTGHGQQGRRVCAVGQLREHVEPLPHRVAQHLPEYLVHRNVTITFPPARRPHEVRSAAGRVGRR